MTRVITMFAPLSVVQWDGTQSSAAVILTMVGAKKLTIQETVTIDNDQLSERDHFLNVHSRDGRTYNVQKNGWVVLDHAGAVSVYADEADIHRKFLTAEIIMERENAG